MVKVACLATRKQGMSREDFKHHYDNKHVPLVMRSFPMIERYARNFVVPRPVASVAPAPAFDALTMFWFADNSALASFMALFADPAIGPDIAADSERFIDQKTFVSFGVDEVCCVQFDADGSGNDNALPKMIALLRRRADVTREAFVDYCIRGEALRAIVPQPDLLASHSCDIVKIEAVKAENIETAEGLPEYDVIVEFRFRSRDEFDRFNAGRERLDSQANGQAGLEPLFERSQMLLFAVEESVTHGTH